MRFPGCRLSSRSRGTSLVELMVASALVGLLMFELWSLVSTGGRFYLKAKSQGDIQRNALLALRWMAKDLAEGSPISFRQYAEKKEDGTPTGFTHEGIVFGSPSRTDGSVSYDDKGHLIWNSVIGFYIEPEGGVLYRQQIELPEPKKIVPPIIKDDLHSTDVMATLARPRLIARHIQSMKTVQGPSDIKIELSSRDETLGFGIKVQTRLEMKN